MTKHEKKKHFLITTYDYDGVPIDWYEFYGDENAAKAFGKEKAQIDYARFHSVAPLLNLFEEE